jgi:DNA-binding transcriptional MerR regulator
MAVELTIGRLAQATGCKVPTIRYYEKIGLLPEPRRSTGNIRLYGASHLARLGFIQHCRELGFPQAAVRQLLELSDHPDQSCKAVTDIARAHLTDVNRRIGRLVALKSELEGMIENCSGGRVEQCRIVEALADYSPDRT